ncbi:acylneuraminate cytidylyltransferase [Clostridium botulinum]|uniref:Putative N-acylneuraminate cytidylyltransferase n=1 Tax=Clostridium botulinum (strain Langeland / NCTC 10281 / Type F) TaxID=441772 RepID=A7GGU1_CLOBL|nr:acylneuraminate cytidylyltransferase family protein [Clostridium botulinum]ABS39781.1 putative N-acylneuraminate cytidylyltransferase [Clostridium botulinum F str. Langeland]ADG00394.1 putative N-acylneuraminate cytidylyltransferase [Clostridium botulinum F str. 230613]KKM41115.1 acylneuraminate cytidylyltransferase [Clostridium botulinum]KOM96824.1 acylneuraminate cytidylyltransferase [Clostridium botulinum]KOM99241.1 acylneuraminate cytidylyltransferase [Clostridium botulinum]
MLNKKILAIIPARGGSKGVKKKNIKNLAGKPLINWTIDEAKQSKYIDRIVVSTEDLEICTICNNFNTEVIVRPIELAQDDSPTIDSIIYTLDILKEQGYVPEYVILLQCTTPFRTVTNIDEAIENFLVKEKEVDSLVSVKEEEYPPYWLKRIGVDGVMYDFIEYNKFKFTRRQDFPKLYKLNGAIYISKTEKIYINNSFESNKSMAFIMDNRSSIDIDTEDDFKFAEYIAAEILRR